MNRVHMRTVMYFELGISPDEFCPRLNLLNNCPIFGRHC